MYPNEEDEPPWINEIIHQSSRAPAPPIIDDPNQAMPVPPISEENDVNEEPTSFSITCRICQNDFATKTELGQHLITDHNISATGNTNVLQNVVDGGALYPDSFACRPCGRLFKHIHDYIAHKSLTFNMKCRFCSDTYSCIGRWTTHTLMMHCQVIEDFRCKDVILGRRCNHILSNRYNLVAHYATHVPKIYLCPVCNEVKYKTENGLVKHLKTHKAQQLIDYNRALQESLQKRRQQPQPLQ
jgi:hypothetical protein